MTNAMVAALAVAMWPTIANSSEWKFLDPLSVDNRQYLLFYDATSVAKEGPILRVWVRWISVDDHAAAVGDLKDLEEITKEAELKVKEGYRPPRLLAPGYELLLKKRGEQSVFRYIKQTEILANRGAKPSVNTLYELDCKGKMVRVLDTVESDAPKRPSSSAVAAAIEWRPIIPDSMADILTHILCN